MTVLLRFADLIERGIVDSWPQLKRLRQPRVSARQDAEPERRAWAEAEVDEWIASRPVENIQPLKGGAKARREQALAKREASANLRTASESPWGRDATER